MEILIYLFIIGVMLMIIFYVGAIFLAPILVAGGLIGAIFGAIIKLIVGFFEFFGFTLRKVSEFETGKSQEEQMREVKLNRKKTKNEEWEELVSGNDVAYETRVEKPSNPDNNINVEDIYSNGKLPSGFFDEI